MVKDLFVSVLNDLYGALLTDKQSAIIKEYYDMDYSLAEIAQNSNVTRQAVHFSVKQATESLYEYESKLHLAQKMSELTAKIANIKNALICGDIISGKKEIEELENNIRSYYGTIQ